MQLLGTIIRLQVQQSSLKVGVVQKRRYEPAPIISVAEFRLDPGGVTVPNGAGMVVDVHHRDHPESRQSRRGVNAVSLGFSAHYAAMRDRFGDHLRDGIAGENILIESEHPISARQLAGGVVIRSPDGAEACLENIIVAEPCVEFTRYSLRRDPDSPSDAPFLEALDFLRAGTRGFYATYAGEPITVRLGDRVFLPAA